MERLDAIVAGLGILVVAVALGGVVATGPGTGLATFRVVFTEQRVPLEAQDGAFAGDGSLDIPVQVNVTNLTSLTFTVRVTGPGPRAAADGVEATLTGPDGRSESQQGQLGPGGAADATLTFERAVRPLPAEQRIQARSEADAVARASGGAPGNGTGAWTLTVSVSGGALPQLHTENHSIVVETVASAFRGVVQPDVANPR